MRAFNAPTIKQSIHWDFPKARDLGLAFATPVYHEAIIRHTIIKSIWPERVGIRISDGNRRRGGRIVCESGLGQEPERINSVLKIGSAETSDVFKGDARE